MTLIDALKDEDIINIRISHGNKWMYYDKSSLLWNVMERKYHSKYNTVLYEGDSEEDAVQILTDNA